MSIIVAAAVDGVAVVAVRAVRITRVVYSLDIGLGICLE